MSMLSSVIDGIINSMTEETRELFKRIGESEEMEIRVIIENLKAVKEGFDRNTTKDFIEGLIASGALQKSMEVGDDKEIHLPAVKVTMVIVRTAPSIFRVVIKDTYKIIVEVES